MDKKEHIVIFGAHSDDFVIGAGGTLAKYSQTKKITSVVFSYGEKSHPWLKDKVVQEMRAEEAYRASKLLGCKTIFFDLREGNFTEEYIEKNIEKKLFTLLKKNPPVKLFTHSSSDPHPDHQAVYKITLEIWEKLPSPKPEVYIYSIWNPISIKTQFPVLYEDITPTFSRKIQALKKFRSQKVAAFYPSLLMFLRDFKNGLKIKKRFAERFYRIK